MTEKAADDESGNIVNNKDILGNNELDTVILESGVLHPVIVQTAEPFPRTHPLSIIDCTVVKFGATGAVWFFDPPSLADQTLALSTTHLLKTLQHTINAYPEWAGQIHWTDFDPTNTKGHGSRYGRAAITLYGEREKPRAAEISGDGATTPSVQSKEKGSTDPGFHYTVHSHSKPLSTYLPPRYHRASSSCYWDVKSDFPSTTFMPQDKVAFHSGNDFLGRPLMAVQITRFDCGSVGVGLKMCHAIADATSMMTFLHDWTAVSRSILSGSGPITIPPRLPSANVIDSLALGDIDAATPDRRIIEKSRALPMHRYSWWDSAEGAPEYFEPSTVMPEDLADYPQVINPGERMPWEKWEVGKPVQHYALHFTESEIHRIWLSASDIGGGEKQRVSRLDAIQAHIWGCIMRARQIGIGEEVHFDMSFGFRARLGLSADHLGSPLRLCYATARGSQAGPSDIAVRARLIRDTIRQFDGPALRAVLHDLAHEASAQRIWATFLGRGNTLVSSWAKIGVYEVDFGGGTSPTYVDALMPACDGMVQIMEGAPTGHVVRPADDGQTWLQHGLDIGVYLQDEVMTRFLADDHLRQVD